MPRQTDNVREDTKLNKVDIADVDFDATSEIKFDYLGSPYTGNDKPLNSGVINLSAVSLRTRRDRQAEGTAATVTVEPATGFVSVVGE